MKTFVVSSALVSAVMAHGGVTGFDIAGSAVPGFKSYNTPVGQNTAQRPWATFDPITDPNSPSIVCNTPGTPQPDVVDVAAGSKITAKWNDYTHEAGPIVIWMTECPGNKCSTWDGQGAKWFKIDERGLVSGNVASGTWGAGEMIKNGKKWEFTVPKSLKSAQYLIRTEAIAMHSTPPQWYPQCLQINLTGGGSDVPPASARAAIPGVYKVTDPIWAKPIYSRQSETSVTIPGPAVWKGGSSGGSAPTTPTAPKSSARPSIPSIGKGPLPPLYPSNPAKDVTPAPSSVAQTPADDDDDDMTAPAETYPDGSDTAEPPAAEDSEDTEPAASQPNTPAPPKPATQAPTNPTPAAPATPAAPQPNPPSPPSTPAAGALKALPLAVQAYARSCDKPNARQSITGWLVCTVVDILKKVGA